MTDAELTRLAFKAAFSGAEISDDRDMLKRWSPLTDDGDALRLAVKLNLGISIPGYKTVSVDVVCFRNSAINIREVGADQYATTRRAIVKAAAEIGKEME